MRMQRKSPNDGLPKRDQVRLPNEIVVRILEDTPLLELVRCREVCRRFRSLVDDTPSIQYSLECALCGVKRISSTRLGTQDALERLRKWRYSSIALDTTEEYELPYLRHGATRLPGSNTVVARTCVAQVSLQDRDLLITQMQSRYRNIPLKQWTVKSQGNAPVFFEMDQSQDLLIVVESSSILGEILSGFKIDSLSLSTGERHPDGLQQPIELAFAFPVLPVSNMRLCISDSHVAVILFHLGRPIPHSEIWVWDWKTGELKLNAYGVPKIGRLIASSLVFLDAAHILVPFWTPMEPLQDADIMHLRIFSFEPGDAFRKTFEDTEAVAMFKLPELNHRMSVLKLDGGGNPFTQNSPPPDCDAPFEADMRSRIFVLNIVLMANNYRQPQYFHLFVPMAVFARSCSVRRFHVVDWDSWAGEARLVHKQPRGLVSDGHIFQNRALFPELRVSDDPGETESPDSPRFVIYDFSLPAALRRDMRSQRFRNCEYFFEPTVLANDGNGWKHPITTGESLPFRKIWTPFRLPMQSGMFSLVEDSVILGDEEGSSWRIHQF